MKKLLFSIMVILIMSAGCTFVADIVEVVNQPPTAYIDSISPTDASVGETVIFDGHGTDADGTVVAYRWRSSLDGDLSAKASFDTSSLSVGEHTIYLKVQDNTGGWSEEVRSRITVSGGAAAVPAINSFGASPGSITSGASSTLSWDVSDATAVSIDKGVGAVAATGTTAVSPFTTTQYTLTATNAAGSTTATTQVVVLGAAPPPAGLPVISSFTASPGSITVGDSSTLSWNVSNATSVTIDQGVGAVAAVGSTPVSPATTTTYALTAINASGLSWHAITVVVGAAPAAGEPDLVILDIWRDGDTIHYTIKNQGLGVAGASTSVLLVDGGVQGFDNVGSLAAGASSDESFGYSYACSGATDTILVRADKDSVVDESSEANNEYSEGWMCIIFIPPPLLMKPDLVIQDIWLVHEMVADRIYYRIKNEGTGAAGESTTALRLYPCVAPCPPVATDVVGPLAAGEVREEKFGAYKYTGGFGMGSVGVHADENESVDESDEGNNSDSKDKSSL